MKDEERERERERTKKEIIPNSSLYMCTHIPICLVLLVSPQLQWKSFPYFPFSLS